MQKRLIIIGIAAVIVTTCGYVAAQSEAQPAERQSLLSRLRQATTARHDAPNAEAQVAQTRGYRPGVTIPQGQQQAQPQQQQQRPGQPVYPQQPRYPAYPPQQVAPGGQRVPQLPYNMQGQPTPRAGAQQQQPQRARSSENSRSNDNDSDNNEQRSSRRSSDSDNDSRSSSRSSRSSSSDDNDRKSSSDESRSNSKSDKNDSEDEESSSKSKSSALEKIARKVESDDDSEEKTNKDSDKSEKEKEAKKSEEEIAREKAHAAFLKAADEATTVVAKFLKQANDGYYSKASDSLSPAIKKYFDSEISAVNGTEKAVLDELTNNGTITMVTYVNTTVRGEGAVVEAELGYADGRTARRSFDLIKIDDDWKIVLPVKGIMSNGQPATAAPRATAPRAGASPNAAERAAAANVAAHAAAQAPGTPSSNAVVPPTAEQAAANANPPLVLAPDAVTTSAQ